MKYLIKKTISLTNLFILVEFLIFGIFSLEFYSLSHSIAVKLSSHIIFSRSDYSAFALSIVGLFLTFIYLYGRGFFLDFLHFLKSKRIDIIIVVLIGILIGWFFVNPILKIYNYKIVSFFSDDQLLIIVVIPLILFFLLILLTFQKWVRSKKQKNLPFFISDIEKVIKKDDLLGYSESAERFAARVINNWSSESIIFGIDAPWGVGKSTFVNFCIEYWSTNYKNDIIVYNFSPLRYEDRNNLLEKFIDGLICEIQKNAFTPEIKKLFYKYSKFIKARPNFSFLGIELSPGHYTIDDALEDLHYVLSDFSQRIVVIVDDLDRLPFSSIQDVLFAIKKSFTLPNISYILCYDAENINSLEMNRPDIEKVTEFLEKFVNVKIGLYIDNTALQKYISGNLAKALSGNSQADPILISKAIGGLMDIYKAPDGYRYLPFVGDVRKLKRLINTLLLLDIEKTDFDNSDFNNKDLINLLLIYINYPIIFRKIHETESRGKRGFFSAVTFHDLEYYPEDLNSGASRQSYETVFSNSKQYLKYIAKLSANQSFLVDNVFNVKARIGNTLAGSVSEEMAHTFACFNGGIFMSRNLEEYLNLIIKLSKPQKYTQYKFYLNCKNKIVNGKSVEEVLSDKIFSYIKSEKSHEQFWRVVTNSAREFSGEVGAKLIRYILNNIEKYSLFSIDGISDGLRDDLSLYLVKILDMAGWVDDMGEHGGNSEKNISEIAEWIFGELRHSGEGVLEHLAREDKGILGLYDLLLFRLFCSSDRGGDIFNLERALSKHGDIEAPTDGPVMNIVINEMRAISQQVFKIFMFQYIKKDKNIFELVDSLTIKNFAGMYHNRVTEKIKAGGVKDVGTIIGTLKTSIKSFIIFQLSNSLMDSGIGCGYYDMEGKNDNKGIKKVMNEYIFGTCFNHEKSVKNYEYFVDFLLINFVRVSRMDNKRLYEPSINSFVKLLEGNLLLEYWKQNRSAIRSLNLQTKGKIIYTQNYSVSYKDDLVKLYDVLDIFIEETETKIK